MENYSVRRLSNRSWEEALDFLTADMDPQDIDISVLAERYRTYIDELEDNNLEVPAKAVRICSALLRMKTYALAGDYQEEEEEQEENPMDFEEEELIEDEELLENDEPDLNIGPDLEVPVKPKPKRRMSLDELKTALEDAMDVKEKREQRQQRKQQIDDPIEMDEKTLEEKINSLFSRLSGLLSGGKDRIHFNQLLEEQDNEERIEKFLHVLHLENDRKVECIQEEWLGDLEVKPVDKPEEVAN